MSSRWCGELAGDLGHFGGDLGPRPLPFLELLDDGRPEGFEVGRALLHADLLAEASESLPVHLRGRRQASKGLRSVREDV